MHQVLIKRWHPTTNAPLAEVRVTHGDWTEVLSMECGVAGLTLASDAPDDPYWWAVVDTPEKVTALAEFVHYWRADVTDPEGLLPPLPEVAVRRGVGVYVEERYGRPVAHVRTGGFSDVIADVAALPNSAHVGDGGYTVPVIEYVTEESLRQFVTRWGADLFDLDDVLGLQKPSSTDNRGDRTRTPTPPRSPHDHKYDHAEEDSIPAW